MEDFKKVKEKVDGMANGLRGAKDKLGETKNNYKS